MKLSGWFRADHCRPRQWSSRTGGPALGAAYLVVRFVNPGGIGLGDVKLAAGLLGAYLAFAGWVALVIGTIAAFATAGLYAAALLAARHATRYARIAFGPWMLLGAAIGLAFGPQL